LVVISQK